MYCRFLSLLCDLSSHVTQKAFINQLAQVQKWFLRPCYDLIVSFYLFVSNSDAPLGQQQRFIRFFFILPRIANSNSKPFQHRADFDAIWCTSTSIFICKVCFSFLRSLNSRKMNLLWRTAKISSTVGPHQSQISLLAILDKKLPCFVSLK